MSYDVELVIDTGGEFPARIADMGSCTYSAAPMLLEAFGKGGIRRLDGLPASECAPKLGAAIDAMRSNPEKYQSMGPPHRRGSYEGCLQWLVEILKGCKWHSKTTLRIT